jgi:ABC-type oligopeptide transport system ATPase subunit
MFEYIAKAKAKKIFYVMSDIGHIHDKVWNLGNLCIINGNVVPSDELISIEDNVYMLQMTDSLQININPEKMKKGLIGLANFYPDFPMIMGWATAHIFYRQLAERRINLPLLFLHGSSESGKSTLAEVILMLHGAKRGEIEKAFRASMASKTSTAAMDRKRQQLHSIPMHIDEYHDKDWESFKALYDRSGAIKSKSRTEKETYSMEINCGTIISSCNPPTSHETEELVNRCLYVEMSQTTHRDFNGKDFEETLYECHEYLGSYIIEVILNHDIDSFLTTFMSLKRTSFFAGLEVKKSRIESNFRLAMAGWEFAKQYFPDYKMPEKFWEKKYEELLKWCKGQGVANKFLRVLCRAYHHVYHRDKFILAPTPFYFEDEEYQFLHFKFNSDLWMGMIELDNRAEKLLAGVTMQQVESAVRLEMPKRLKNCAYKTGNWVLALRTKELESVKSMMKDKELAL